MSWGGILLLLGGGDFFFKFLVKPFFKVLAFVALGLAVYFLYFF